MSAAVARTSIRVLAMLTVAAGSIDALKCNWCQGVTTGATCVQAACVGAADDDIMCMLMTQPETDESELKSQPDDTYSDRRREFHGRYRHVRPAHNADTRWHVSGCACRPLPT